MGRIMKSRSHGRGGRGGRRQEGVRVHEKLSKQNWSIDRFQGRNKRKILQLLECVLVLNISSSHRSSRAALKVELNAAEIDGPTPPNPNQGELVAWIVNELECIHPYLHLNHLENELKLQGIESCCSTASLARSNRHWVFMSFNLEHWNWVICVWSPTMLLDSFMFHRDSFSLRA